MDLRLHLHEVRYTRFLCRKNRFYYNYNNIWIKLIYISGSEKNMAKMMKFFSLIHEFNHIAYGETRNKSIELELQAEVNKKWNILDSFCKLTTLITPINLQLPAWKRKEYYQVESSNKDRLPDWEIEAYAFRFVLPFNLSSGGARCTLHRYLIQLFLIHMIFKGFALCMIYGSFGNLLIHWSPDLSSINPTNYTTRCIILETLKEKDQMIARKLYKYVDDLNSFGSTVITMNDLVFCLFIALIYFYIIFMYFAIRNRNSSDFAIHPLTFHYKPSIERRRLTHKYKQLMQRLVRFCDQSKDLEQTLESARKIVIDDNFDNIFANMSSHLIYQNYQKTFSQEQYLKHDLDEPIKPVCKEDFLNFLNWLTKRKMLTCFESYQEDLDEEETEKHVLAKKASLYDKQNTPDTSLLPAHLTLKNHRAQLRNANFVTICWIIGISLVCGLICLGLWYREIEERVGQRIEQIHCKKWHPMGISRKWLSYLQDLTNENHIRAYEEVMQQNYQKNLLINLGIWIELPLVFTPRASFLAILVYANFTILNVCFGLYILSASMNHFNLGVWSKQINHQLKLIGSLMEQLDVEANVNEIAVSAIVQSDLIVCKIQIERALRMTYANFILFFEELRPARKYLRIVILQLAVIAIGSIVLVSFILQSRSSGTGIRSNLLIIWYLMLCFVGLFDVYFLMSVKSTNRIQILFGHINMLMAKSTSVSMETCNFVTLWRRQILTYMEVESVFGIQTLGFDLTYSNFIQFNSYVLGGSLYMFRYYII